MNNITNTPPNMDKLPGGWKLPQNIEEAILIEIPTKDIWVDTNDSKDFFFVLLEEIFSKDECQSLATLLESSPRLEKVSIQGRTDVLDDRVGSIRTTIWSEELAKKFWLKMKPFLEPIQTNRFYPTDWWQGNKNQRIWKPVAISPMLRLMKYEKGGTHFPHYDAGYLYPNGIHRTLYSFVLYLTTNEDGGTRIIDDGQKYIQIWERNHDDWIFPPKNDQILAEFLPTQGNVLLFPHRQCHDVAVHKTDEPRIIIRGDVIFEAVKL